MVSIGIFLCAVVTVSQAKPLEYGSLSGGSKLSPRLLHALSQQQQQHGNQLSGNQFDFQSTDRMSPMSYRDLLSQLANYPSASELPRQPVLQEDSANNQYSAPLEQLLAQLTADYDTTGLSNGNNNNNNEDYYQDQTNGNGLFYGDGQEGWFEGPVVPQVEANTEDDQLTQLLLEYLVEHYKQEDDDDSNVEKRRQKIVIKDDFTELTPASSTAAPFPSTASPRKMKPIHKSIKPMTAMRRGQKEVPLLRPAEIKPKEWPSELEESSLSEVSVSGLFGNSFLSLPCLHVYTLSLLIRLSPTIAKQMEKLSYI